MVATKKVVTKCIHLKHAPQTLLHCFFPLITLFEALPNLMAFNPEAKEKIRVWSSWQQKVNSGPQGLEVSSGWAGPPRHRVAEAVAGIHYISFRSSRVWSSILCVQRCSSLVDFSLSGRKQESRVTRQLQTTEEPSPKKACTSPFPARCRSKSSDRGCLAGCS